MTVIKLGMDNKKEEKDCTNCKRHLNYWGYDYCKKKKKKLLTLDICEKFKEAKIHCNDCEKKILSSKVIFCDDCGFGFCEECIRGYENVPDVHNKPLAFCKSCFPGRKYFIELLRGIGRIVEEQRLTDEKYLLTNWSDE